MTALELRQQLVYDLVAGRLALTSQGTPPLRGRTSGCAVAEAVLSIHQEVKL